VDDASWSEDSEFFHVGRGWGPEGKASALRATEALLQGHGPEAREYAKRAYAANQSGWFGQIVSARATWAHGIQGCWL
jgi:hypothetical protein